MNGRLKVGYVQPNVKVQQVIITERNEGAGTDEEPIRIVRYIHNLDGRLLGKLDELKEEEYVDTRVPWRMR